MTAIFFSVPIEEPPPAPVKNPIQRPSGEKKGLDTLSSLLARDQLRHLVVSESVQKESIRGHRDCRAVRRDGDGLASEVVEPRGGFWQGGVKPHDRQPRGGRLEGPDRKAAERRGHDGGERRGIARFHSGHGGVGNAALTAGAIPEPRSEHRPTGPHRSRSARGRCAAAASADPSAEQRRSSVRMCGGVSGGQRAPVHVVLEHRGQRDRDVSPSNARRPVSISKRTTPNAQMSARLSTARPRACSGAM